MGEADGHDRRLLRIAVLWATESGRAKACARRAVRLLRSSSSSSPIEAAVGGVVAPPPLLRGVRVDGLCPLDGVDFLSLGASSSSSSSSSSPPCPPPLLLLFVSTTGDAEFPSNGRVTWNKLLKKSLSPSSTFAGTNFALFALGDRNYGPDAFCAAGRKLAARLVQLGARPVCDVGYGDDGSSNGGAFADLDVWLDGRLFPALATQMGTREQ